MTTSTMTAHPLVAKFAELRKQLNDTYLEREDAILACLLAVLSAEHVFLLGPPGTAKSQMVRALVRAITGARYAEFLFSKTTPVEKVMGPLDIKRFRENGDYILKREGYASKVHYLFCDELGKMSPILGHDMLALVNERVYHEVNDEGSVHEAPLLTMFGASNETLTDHDDNSAAFWDRQLFRVLVDSLQDDDNFRQLILGAMPDPDVEIDFEELQDVIANVVPAITIDEHATRGLISLRHEFRREHLNPSDRRWRQSVKALKAHAFLNGRSEVVEDDLAVLRFTLWDTVEQIDKVSRLCMIAANPFVERLLQVAAQITEVDNAISERVGPDSNGNSQRRALTQYGREAISKLNTARTSLDALLLEAAGRPIPGFRAASDEHRRTIKRAFTVCLEQTDAEAEIMMRDRLGSGDGGNQ